MFPEPCRSPNANVRFARVATAASVLRMPVGSGSLPPAELFVAVSGVRLLTALEIPSDRNLPVASFTFSRMCFAAWTGKHLCVAST